MKFVARGVISAALFIWAGQAQAITNLAANGSFEQVDASAVFTNGVAQVTGRNTTVLPGWRVPGRAQLKINRNYVASDGNTSIDLSGFGGYISTALNNFVVGKTYRVSFDLSGNPDATVDPMLELSATGYGRLTGFTFHRPQGQAASNMGWVRVFADFVAYNTSHEIGFSNDNLSENRDFGPVIDNVVISGTVPEPQNWALFIIGFGLIGAMSRHGVTQHAA